MRQLPRAHHVALEAGPRTQPSPSSAPGSCRRFHASTVGLSINDGPSPCPSRWQLVKDAARVSSFLRTAMLVVPRGRALGFLGDVSAGINITADAVFGLTADVFYDARRLCRVVGFCVFPAPGTTCHAVTVTKIVRCKPRFEVDLAGDNAPSRACLFSAPSRPGLGPQAGRACGGPACADCRTSRRLRNASRNFLGPAPDNFVRCRNDREVRACCTISDTGVQSVVSMCMIATSRRGVFLIISRRSRSSCRFLRLRSRSTMRLRSL